MKAIVTKYVGPTDTKPSRIIAKAEGVKPLTMSYDHGFDTEGNHANAARLLCARMGWNGSLASGGMPASDSYCHCFVPQVFEQAKVAVFETRLAMRKGRTSGNPHCHAYGKAIDALTDDDQHHAGAWAYEFEVFAASREEVAA